MQPLLRVASLARDESASAYGKLSPRQARDRIRAGAAAAAGPKQPLPAVHDLAIPGPAGAIPARFYEPPGMGIENRPLVVYFHGGGWMIGDLDTRDSVCRFLAANVPAPRCSRSTTGSPPSTPSRPRSKTPSLPSAGRRPKTPTAGSRPGADRRRRRQRRRQPRRRASVCSPRDEDGPSPAMQALIYPVTDYRRRPALPRRIRRGLPADQGRHGLVRATTICRRASIAPTLASPCCAPRTSPACRPPTSPPPASTHCATRARPTPSGCARPASR